MTTFHESFIENLKYYRHLAGYTQEKLAELCNVSVGTIGNIEIGTTKPSFDLIFFLADSLHIPPEYLVKNKYKPGESKLEECIIEADTLNELSKTITEEVAKTIQEVTEKIQYKIVHKKRK